MLFENKKKVSKCVRTLFFQWQERKSVYKKENWSLASLDGEKKEKKEH
jgi:hypothetical protein